MLSQMWLFCRIFLSLVVCLQLCFLVEIVFFLECRVDDSRMKLLQITQITGNTVKSNWTQDKNRRKQNKGAFQKVQKKVYSCGTWIRFGCQRSVTAGGKALFDCCPTAKEHILTAFNSQTAPRGLHSLMWESYWAANRSSIKRKTRTLHLTRRHGI